MLNESHLKESEHFGKHIRRGELVELLAKALLYVEVETHWKADELSTKCQTGFSLLRPHICSAEPPPPRPTWSESSAPPLITVQTHQLDGLLEAGSSAKRKAVTASPAVEPEPHTEKRRRRDVDPPTQPDCTLFVDESLIRLIENLQYPLQYLSGLCFNLDSLQ
jgi:transducin (beta)-like 1